MPELNAHGLTVHTPAGWEGRIFRRLQHGQVASASGTAPPGPAAPEGEETYPVLHVATVALPNGVGDYGSEAVGNLGEEDALIVVKEFAPRLATEAVFSTPGLPRSLQPDDFSPQMLQRLIQGQAGVQRFGNEAGRAFCLYVVLGSWKNRKQVVPGVNQVLSTLHIDPGAHP
jgi:hypothetical protein